MKHIPAIQPENLYATIRGQGYLCVRDPVPERIDGAGFPMSQSSFLSYDYNGDDEAHGISLMDIKSAMIAGGIPEETVINGIFFDWHYLDVAPINGRRNYSTVVVETMLHRRETSNGMVALGYTEIEYPVFVDWSVEFFVSYDPSMISRHELARGLIMAGRIGIGYASQINPTEPNAYIPHHTARMGSFALEALDEYED
jgi:hypothetical protein